MVNLISKIALPFVLSSSLLFNSLDVKSQEKDSLTSNIISSYDTLKKDLLLSFNSYSKLDGSFRADYYDIDYDGKVDVKEIFICTPGNLLKDNPLIYYFDTNKDGNFSEYMDLYEDGLNGNEFYSKPEEDIIDASILNL